LSGRRFEHAFIGTAALGFSLCVFGDAKEAAFVKEAIQGNLAEVRIGQLAAQRTQSDAIRRFGETIRQDHSVALQRTKRIAESMNVAAPTELSADAKRRYDDLVKLSGSYFDAAFARQMVSDHEASIAKYRAHTESDDDAVASYVKESLPALETHLEMARELLRKGAPASSSPPK